MSLPCLHLDHTWPLSDAYPSPSCLYILRRVQQTLWHSVGKGTTEYAMGDGFSLRKWELELGFQSRTYFCFNLYLIITYFTPTCPHNIIFHLNTVIPLLQIFCMKWLTRVSKWLTFSDPLTDKDWLTGSDRNRPNTAQGHGKMLRSGFSVVLLGLSLWPHTSFSTVVGEGNRWLSNGGMDLFCRLGASILAHYCPRSPNYPLWTSHI